MKFFYSFTIGIVVALLIMGGIVFFFLPSAYKIQQQVLINASQKEVFNQVDYMKNWGKWAFEDQKKKDRPEVFLQGPEDGIGAIIEWTDEYNTVRIEIVVSEPYDLIKAKILNVKGGQESELVFEFIPENDQIRLKLAESGDFGLDFSSRLNARLFDFEGNMEQVYLSRLLALKESCEK
ncbi:MAG: hypothetical protein KTR26_00660 [Flammeovirgaceae bacterium]|nr:hypothetical protein [Flammeovirgaceae bacterium]